ncbi:hypothetical protein ACH42_05240 [Endozoicomonas sp. (ex Bugula neritina AB1)]|nr:hypothetical protein ACH42_05240 [Endozoicomonas sp. (ex Bugula neritina AB1)]
MTKIIRSTSELPEWFNIEKYDAVTNLTTSQIANELSFRRRIYHQENAEMQKTQFYDLEDYTLVSLFPDQDGYSNYLEWRTKAFRSAAHIEPLVILPDDDEDNLIIAKMMEEKGVDAYLNECNQYEALLAKLWDESPFTGNETDLVRFTQYFDVQRILDYSASIPEFRSDMDSHFLRLDDLTKEESEKSDIHLTISLEADDKNIIRDVKKQISVARKHTGISGPSKIASSTNINKIKHYRILAYIDLLIWSRINGYRITDSAASNALFKDGFYGESKIKDTIRPLALAVLEPQFINSIKK